jgi:hypothetical protein
MKVIATVYYPLSPLLFNGVYYFSDHPKDTEMTVHATPNYGNLHVEVLFTKVYPLPICSFTYIVNIMNKY